MKSHRFLIVCIFLFASLFVACSTSAKSSNLFTRLDTIDSLISQGQNTDALKELKKTEKLTYDSWSYIGIYKRYILLGEKKSAEKLLKKAIKKNSKNPELLAVYASFLNHENRFGEAEKISRELKSTKYASIYAEAVFQNKKSEMQNADSKLLYEDEQYYDLFFNSYQASLNPVWIRNCAAFYLNRGFYETAGKLTPTAFNDADDAYFWALVNYDAGNYADTVNALESGFEFLESLGKKSSLYVTEIKMTALESDAYTALSDLESAKLIRDNIIAEYVSAGAVTTQLSADDKKLLPLIIVNGAISENENGNDYAAADLLFYSVVNFPEYVPGLISYADFAYNSNLMRREDDEMVALRKVGIRSREMERYDNRAQIPLSDAVSRIDHALATLTDPLLPYLYITKLDLRYKMDNTLTTRDKTADLWQLLEQSSTETIKYHDVLVLYAVNFLLETNQTEDAEDIFRKYMTSKFSFKSDADFFEQVLDVLRMATVEDIELAAYFAVLHGKTDEAVRMYEYCVFESAGIKTNDISQKVSAQSASNLANIYFSTGKKDKALDLYGRVASRETNINLRSEIFYRIASIYATYGDNQNALRAVDYAYSINPANAKAHLLKTKLQQTNR